MECIYCGATESGEDDNEITTHNAGDESVDICEACYENMFA